MHPSLLTTDSTGTSKELCHWSSGESLLMSEGWMPRPPSSIRGSMQSGETKQRERSSEASICPGLRTGHSRVLRGLRTCVILKASCPHSASVLFHHV